MITKVKCVGIKRGVSKKQNNKPFATLYFDVTNICKDNESDFAGSVISQHFKWGRINDSVVGADMLCSVDDFGNVTDVQL